MNIKSVLLAASIATMTACVGSRQPVRLESAASSLETPLAPLSAEPLGCPVYAGDDRPDYDAQALDCIVKWLAEAREYRAKGGKPTKNTSLERFEGNRAAARKLSARLSNWLEKTRFDFPLAPTQSGSVARTPTISVAGQESQQRYLSGLILFQKGDTEGARREWLLAKQLDPSNADAKAALERLAR